MKQRTKYKFTWKVKSLMSYILLAVSLLILVCVPTYQIVKSSARKDIYEANERAVNSFMAIMDDFIEQMNKHAFETRKDERMIPHLLSSNGYNASVAASSLKHHCIINPVYEGVLIMLDDKYFPLQQKVISSEGFMTADLFFNYYYHFENWDYKDVYKNMLSNNKPVFSGPFRAVKQNYAEHEYYIYMHPMTDSTKNSRGVIVYLIDRDKIMQSLNLTNLRDNSGLCIYREDGTHILSNNIVPCTDVHADVQTGTWNTVKTKNGAYNVYALVSGDTGWKYVMSVPQKSIHAETLHNTLPIICVIAFGLIASILLAALFTKYSTRPISLLSGKAMSLVPDAVKDSDDDLEKIEISMLRLHAEKNELNMQLHSQRSILRSYLFACLFYGEKDKLDAFYKILQKDHISLDGKVFRVLAISCHGEKSDEEAENEHAMGELVKYALIKILRELIKETGLQGICCDVRGDTIALLLNADSMDESVLNVFVHEFNQRTRLHFGVGITAGVSGEFESLEDTDKYFTQALNALEMRYLRGLNVAIHHEEWKIASASEMNDMNSAASAIAENLTKGAYEECAKGVLQYVGRIKKSNYSAQNAKRMMTMLLVSLQQALRSMPGAQLDLSQLMYFEFETINDVAQELVENIMSCQTETEKELGGRFDSIATLALDYVKANLSKPVLNMNMIAEACGVSASYVTQAFKGKYATTPMQYLDSIRMEHACTLLRETDLKINDILNACGYVDRANFMRKFKKMNLLTPMEYRKVHKNSLNTESEQNSNEEGESEE